MPLDHSLPFFSYGVFKPGELGFLRIRRIVEEAEEAVAEGYLFERNGTAVFSQSFSPSPVGGYLLQFSEYDEAYDEIRSVEPEGQYEPHQLDVETTDGVEPANVLVVREDWDQTHGPIGSITPMEHELHEQYDFDWYERVTWWNGRDDILFTGAIDKINRMIDCLPSSIDPDDPDQLTGSAAEHFFDMQMAYLLLWTVIERFLNIRYATEGQATNDDRKEMATDDPFQEKLRDVVSDKRNEHIILSLRTAEDVFKLDRDDPERAIMYYWRLRNNIAHRGKGAGSTEYKALYNSCSELVQCFKYEKDRSFERSQEYR